MYTPDETAMDAVPFTQYLRPDGRKASVSIVMPSDVVDKANRIIEAGFAFECEHLTTGNVSLTITDPEYGDVDIRVVSNGPAVNDAVQSLIMDFDIAARSEPQT